MNLDTADLLARLAAATLLGAVVGLEREARFGTTAGVRTHALVALGAALFTLVGAYGFTDVERGGIDPSRVAGQVAAGVGFIGAGAVLRIGASVRGLTTAATVWLAAGLGVATAAGGILAAAFAVALALVTLVLLRVVEPLAKRLALARHDLRVEYERGHGTLGPLLRILEEAEVEVEALQVHDDEPGADGDGTRTVTVELRTGRGTDLDAVMDEIGARPEVTRLQIRRRTTDAGRTGPGVPDSSG
ncbi:MAG: MgtC/SapB family protein [Acidimicrobiia bacterium]